MEDNLTIEQFAEEIIPNFKERWEMYSMTPEQLLGRTVVSIRSGFSSIGGGQIMKVDSVKKFNHNIQIHLEPTLDSMLMGDDIKKHLGWGCDWDDRHNSFILLK